MMERMAKIAIFLSALAMLSCSALLNALPPEPHCGNGRPEGDEECDDGNEDDSDGCRRDCTFTCNQDDECRDDNPCNGDETCDIQSHRCLATQNRENGFVCGTDPRYVCVEGSCLRSYCGDGFVDTGAGESCEPSLSDRCDDNCNLICLYDGDCPDDENPCNGEEFCFAEAKRCDHRNPPANGAECNIDPRKICLAGTCQESICGDEFADNGGGEECDDGNENPADGCEPESCLFSCHSDEDCDDGLGCTDDICISTYHVCYSERSAAGTPCRLSAGDCDVEEFCDGMSDACPDDAFVAGGG